MSSPRKKIRSNKKTRWVVGCLVILQVLVIGFGLLTRNAHAEAFNPLGFSKDNDIFNGGSFNLVPGGALQTVPPPASAGFPVADVGKNIWDFVRAIFDQFQDRLEQSLDTAYKRALRGFTQRLAYNAGVSLASKATGQKPLFREEFNITDEFDAAVGDFLNNSLGKAWGKDLCEPLDPLVKVNIEITARQILEPPKPRCRASAITSNIAELRNTTLVEFPAVADIFNPAGSDFGAALSIASGALTAGRDAARTEAREQQAQGSFKPVVDPVTGRVKTPAGLVERLATKALVDEPIDIEKQRSDDPFVNALDLFISTFINTFAGNLMTQLFDEGINPNLTRQLASFDSSGGIGGGIQAARDRFAGLLKPEFGNSSGSVDVSGVLAACDPASDLQASENNCVIDQGFADAIREQKTVGEAIRLGYLHPGWTFGTFANGQGGTSDLSDVPSGLYSQRSIAILRKYGVVPSGWEVAARYIAEVHNSALEGAGQAWTLGELADRDKHFANPDSPFYHLIDPKWVIKTPEVFVRRQGPGEVVASVFEIDVPDIGPDGSINLIKQTLPVRINSNADEQTCIAEDNDGNCTHFGYCTEYRNNWRIKPGETCSEDWVSCQSFVSRQGVTVNYLQNTLDRGGSFSCDQTNVGCNWFCLGYSETQDDWVCTDETTTSSALLCGTATGCSCTVGAETCTIPYNGFVCNTPSGAECLNDVAPGRDPNFARFNRNIDRGVFQCRPGEVGCHGLVQLSDSNGVLLTDAEVTSRITSATGITNFLSYNEVANTVAREVSMKIPPPWAACGPSVPRDLRSESCDNYAQACLATEVGCELYTPISGNTISEFPVPAIVNPTTDICPAECVGFDTFYEQPTFFDDATVGFPLEQYIIPANAEQCAASSVGCELFTNLNKPANSGEREEGYFEVQACMADTASATRYFTWQGSDETGFQLNVWDLLPSNQGGGAPCTNGRATGSTTFTTSCYDDAVYPRTGETLVTKACGPETPTDPNDDPSINPDCVQFIDESFNTFWRLQSQVVEASEECIPLRRAVDDSIWNTVPGKGRACSPGAGGCRQYKGNDGFGYKLIPLGNTQGREDFSDGDSLGWQGHPAVTLESPIAGGRSISPTATLNTLVADFGAICTDPEGCPTATADGQICTVAENEQYCGVVSEHMNADERYSLHVWAMSPVGSGGAIDGLLIHDQTGSSGIKAQLSGTVSVPGDGVWRPYQLGPIVLTSDINGADQISISMLGVFVTNIELRETSDLYLKRQDPWDVPASCGTGTPPQFLGCQAYEDRSGTEWDLFQFSNVCRMEAVGCSVFVDTHNSQSAASEQYNTNNTDARDDWIVPQDSVAYYVDDSSKYCNPNDVGCSMWGRSAQSKDGSVEYEPAYIKVQPDNFPFTMCMADELFCEEFTFNNQKQNKSYFKDPRDRVCEYDDRGRIVNYCDISGEACGPSAGGAVCAAGAGTCTQESIKGWFTVGSNDICQIDGGASFVTFCDEANPAANAAVAFPGCFTKACDQNLSSCTSYRDPLDPPQCNPLCPLTLDPLGQPERVTIDATGACVPCSSGANCVPGCQSYYFLRDTVDEQSCADIGVDPAQECVAFYDTLGDAPYIVSECQPGCGFNLDASGDPILVDEDCAAAPAALSRPQAIDEGYMPGCQGLVAR